VICRLKLELIQCESVHPRIVTVHQKPDQSSQESLGM